MLPTGADASDPAKMAEAIVTAVNVARTRGPSKRPARVLDGKVVLDGLHLRFNPLDTGFNHLANTSGEYLLQIRLEEMQEIPGSTIQYADVRYATNGIEVYGQPGHSPLLGESAEVEGATSSGANDTLGAAQDIGNLLGSDQGTISIAGALSGRTDVDWYRMTVDYNDSIQSIRNGVAGAGDSGLTDTDSIWATMFDIDYADGMARPDLTMWVFDGNGRLILIGGNSDVSDDQPEPITGASIEDLSRGSAGAKDPFIGTAYLPEGNGTTYYIAITSSLTTADALDDVNNLIRREPINSVERIVEEHIDPGTSILEGGTESYVPGSRLELTPNAFTLGDVVMYVNTPYDLYTVDPFTGEVETDVTPGSGNHLPESTNRRYMDIAMRNDGRLYTTAGRRSVTNQHDTIGNIREIDLEDARDPFLWEADEGIVTYRINNQGTGLEVHGYGMQFEAMTFDAQYTGPYDRDIWVVGSTSSIGGFPTTDNLLYLLDEDGVAYQYPNRTRGSRLGTNIVPHGWLASATTLVPPSFATDIDAPNAGQGFTDPGDVLDGQFFTLIDASTNLPLLDTGGNPYRFEFDTGYDVALNADGAAALRDGDYFSLDDGSGSQEYEFDSGGVIVVNNVVSALDGVTVTVVPSVGSNAPTVTFEFNRQGDGNVDPNNVAVEFTTGATRDAVAGLLANAINANSVVGATAVGNRITLTNDRAANPGTSSNPSLVEFQGVGGVTAGRIPISFEETYGIAALGDSVTTSVESNSNVEVGYAERFGDAAALTTAGHRFTFRNAVNQNFTTTNTASPSPAMWYVGGTDGVSPLSYEINVDAGMDSGALANAVRLAITNSGADVVASVVGGAVQVIPGANSNIQVDVDVSNAGPFERAGAAGAAGGAITGITMVGDRMFAVSENGDLFEVLYASYGNWAFNPSADNASPWRTMTLRDPAQYGIANSGAHLELVKSFGSSMSFLGVDQRPRHGRRRGLCQHAVCHDPGWADRCLRHRGRSAADLHGVVSLRCTRGCLLRSVSPSPRSTTTFGTGRTSVGPTWATGRLRLTTRAERITLSSTTITAKRVTTATISL